jgi:hypothetical protein
MFYDILMIKLFTVTLTMYGVYLVPNSVLKSDYKFDNEKVYSFAIPVLRIE